MSMQVSYGHGVWQDAPSNSLAWRCGENGCRAVQNVVRYTDEDGNSRTRIETTYEYDWPKFFGYRLAMSKSFPNVPNKSPQDVKLYYNDLLASGMPVQEARTKTWKEYIIPTYNPTFKGEAIREPKNLWNVPNYTNTRKSNTPPVQRGSTLVSKPSSTIYSPPSQKSVSKAGITPKMTNGVVFMVACGVLAYLLLKR